MFQTARGFGGFAQQTWRNLVDSKYETISVGLVGLGMGAGWTVLLSRVTLFNEETGGSSWLTAPDSTLSCRESGGKSLGYLFRSYAPVVPATVAFVTLRSRTVPWPKVKALISTKVTLYLRLVQLFSILLLYPLLSILHRIISTRDGSMCQRE